MKYYKVLSEGKITMIGSCEQIYSGQIEIPEAEYNQILSTMKQYLEELTSYVEQIQNNTIAIEDVPITHREQVLEKLHYLQSQESNNDYGIPDETYNAIIDDYTLSLMENGLI